MILLTSLETFISNGVISELCITSFPGPNHVFSMTGFWGLSGKTSFQTATSRIKISDKINAKIAKITVFMSIFSLYSDI